MFSSIRVPRQNIKQCMRPRSCDATTRKITMLPRYPPPTCQKINVLKLPNSGFPQKTAPKGRKFKGNIQNLGGILWSSGYWLPLCHIYIYINPVTGATSPIKFAQKPADIFPPAKIPCFSCACCFAGGAH